jgi:competence protein ComEC
LRRSAAPRPLRPLLAPAIALGTGALAGLGLDAGLDLPRGLLLTAGTLAWLVAALRRRVGPSAVLLFLIAGLHAALQPVAPPPTAWSQAEIRHARDRPIAGRWRNARGGRSGWIEPFAGHPRHPGHALRLEPAVAAPHEGTAVVVLPGSAVWPWPRGPEPSPDERSRSFAAWSPVAVDELVGLEPRPARGPLAEMLDILRTRLRERLGRLEGESTRGLLQALVLGERSALDPERTDLFTRTGVRHLLAISGWHVGLFALLVVEPLVGLLRRVRGLGDERWTALLRTVALAGYALLTGAGKPVVRAAVMLGMAAMAGALAARHGRPRRADALSLLAAAFALEALVDPAALTTPSLSLSYAATLGLVVGTGPLLARLRAAGPACSGDSWPAPRRAVLFGVVGRVLAAGLAASSAALLATLPIAWTTFGEVVPLGVVVSVLAGPLVAGLVALAWVGLALPVTTVAAPIEGLGRALSGLLDLADAWPGTPWVTPPRPFVLLAAIPVLAFLGLRGQRLAGRLGALLAAVLLLPWTAAPAGLEVVALDVGHGTCVVLRAPGLEALVFDLGSRDRRGLVARALLPLLARWEADRATVVLSHGHLDHAGGLAALARRIDLVGAFGAVPAQTEVRGPHAGPVDVGPGWSRIPVACPELGLRLERGSEETGNEGSRALRVRWRDRWILLLGDAEEAGLEGLPGPWGPLELLLAPHHGSDARGLPALLARAPPEQVWVSASRPPAIGTELDRRGLRWRWTGRDGPLALRLP